MNRTTQPAKWRMALAAVALCGALTYRASAAETEPAHPDQTHPVQPAPAPDSELAEMIRRGATLEEMARLRDPVAKTPAEAIIALKFGNARFYSGVTQRPVLSANARRAQVASQSPFAVILGCADSRVPTETIYDQNPGSLFVIRVAGNVVEPATLGSVQYAVQHLKSHVVVVMGHEGCGAVAAAMLTPAQQAAEPEAVRFLLERITPSVTGLPAIRDPKARMREAVVANVRLQVHRLKQDPTVAAAIQRGQIKVIGAFYEIGSGAVDFLEEDELSLSPEELQRATQQVRQAGQTHAGAEH